MSLVGSMQPALALRISAGSAFFRNRICRRSVRQSPRKPRPSNMWEVSDDCIRIIVQLALTDCHPYPQLQLRGSRLEKQASCQPRGRMSSIFSDGARTSPLAFEDAGCRSEVTPSGGALGGALLSMSASSNTNSNANSVSLLVAEHLRVLVLVLHT